ncbi:RES family NAD+ phosphorylase [Pseudaminobacter sp. 19-2017]|uniref:RES family NAD+ phosphorylase n=1 Tax=Pseudaminobacter soli (ex Zhang et al. 2022) TaxID=2831468 RepID=A0A942E004_9HYPH|nr:RES family NAD+ phosphorylase [Pseudaminobacter soli]MBS3648295.1 RES family NAD+ phosphorylase [Pseudaminobacter soli]
MRLWRLSTLQFADAFDGGYGLRFDGRWNTVGRPVTYAATSPSLCVLEKLVHVEDPDLMPSLAMVAYEVADDVPFTRRNVDELPADWRRREAETQRMGDEWLAGLEAAILFVPSAVVPISGSPDQNAIVNHRHPAAALITIKRIEPFGLDVRLL